MKFSSTLKSLKLTQTSHSYGTSGYRTHHSNLPDVAKKCAVVALLNSYQSSTVINKESANCHDVLDSDLSNGTNSNISFENIKQYDENIKQSDKNIKQSDKNIKQCEKFLAAGIIITASHNPPCDNGFKYITYNGRMCSSEWQTLSDSLIDNSSSDYLTKFIENYKLNFEQSNRAKPIVFIAADTRESSGYLKQILIDTLNKFECLVLDGGFLSTPLAFYCVRKINEQLLVFNKAINQDSLNNLLESVLDNYYVTMSNFYSRYNSNKISILDFDCANGVGNIIIKKFVSRYNKLNKDSIKLHMHSNNKQVNEECGAVYVQKHGYTGNLNDNYLYSVDGDMDRIVLTDNIDIIDGDWLTVFYIRLFNDKLKVMENIIQTVDKSFTIKDIKVGAVISDYTNGSVKNSIRKSDKLNTNIVKAETGIGNFITEASKFDISVYFEPNGHGGVYIDMKRIKGLFGCYFGNEKLMNEHGEQYETFIRNYNLLKDMSEVFLLLIGDPLPTILMCKLFFDDYFNNNCKLEKFHNSLKALEIDEETVSKLSAFNPEDIMKIYERCNQCSGCKDTDKDYTKIFVRKSGTENILRIYVETQCSKILQLLMSETEKYFSQ